MIRKVLTEKYGQYVTDKLMTADDHVLIENIDAGSMEGQEKVMEHIKNMKDAEGNILAPDHFFTQDVEWGMDFSSWIGDLTQPKDFFIIGAEPSINKNYQLVYDFGTIKGTKDLKTNAQAHYGRDDIWRNLTNVIVSNPNDESVTGFLSKCYITDLCHVVPKKCGQVSGICSALSITPREWDDFRTRVAKRFLVEEIRAVNPKCIILHGNTPRDFFRDQLGVKYDNTFSIEKSKMTVQTGFFDQRYRIISIPHLKGSNNGTIWKNSVNPEKRDSIKRTLHQIISNN